MEKFKHSKTGEVIEGEFYNSEVQPLQKGVFHHPKGNAILARYNGENATILLKEGDFIQHKPDGYYFSIPSVDMPNYTKVEPEADQPAIEPEPETQS